VKKFLSLGLLSLAFFVGGCSIPLSPLWLLIKDQPAPIKEATPDAPQPAQIAPLPTPVMDEDTNGTV